MVAVATMFDLKVSMINDAVTIFSVWALCIQEKKGPICVFVLQNKMQYMSV